MSELIEKFKVVLDFEVTVDPETGEIVTNCVKKTIDKAGFKSAEIKEKKTKKVKKEECSDPKIILEENKYCLNQAAADLIGVEPGDKLDIAYKKQGKTITPIIYKDNKKGNKLNKSLTVACRGSKQEELAKYGTEFYLVPHSEDGVFVLTNKDKEIEENLDDEELPIDETIDVDIQDLLNDEDANITEISAFEYKL